MIDRDQQPLPPGRRADVVDQPAMAVEPPFVRQIVAKIAFEEDDAGGLQILQERAVAHVEFWRRPETNDKMVAHRVD